MDKISEGPVFLPMFLQWAESTSAVDISTPDGLEDAVDRFFATEGITSNKQTLIDSVTRNQVPRPGAFVLGKKSFVPTVFKHKTSGLSWQKAFSFPGMPGGGISAILENGHVLICPDPNSGLIQIVFFPTGGNPILLLGDAESIEAGRTLVESRINDILALQ